MGTLVYLNRGIAKHPRRNKQLPTLDRVYMCVYTANVNVCTAYPSVLKIGRFLIKDKAKRFKSICLLRWNTLTPPQRNKGRKKVEM